MKPVAQTKFGMEGNCWSAAIASLLELPLSEVPEFTGTEGSWFYDWQVWLKQRDKQILLISKDTPPQGYSLADVDSTMPGEAHTVVCLDGKVVWNPLPPHDSHFEKINEFYIIVPWKATARDEHDPRPSQIQEP